VFGSRPSPSARPCRRGYLIGPSTARDVFLNKAKLIAFFVAILIAIVLYLTLEYTRLARRCARRQPDAATYMGIEVDTAYRMPSSCAGITAIAAADGHLISPSVRSSLRLASSCIPASAGGWGHPRASGGLTVASCDILAWISPEPQNAAIFVVF